MRASIAVFLCLATIASAAEPDPASPAQSPSTPASEGRPAGAVEPSGAATPFWKRQPMETPAPLRGVYDKPFLLGGDRQLHLGGYADFDYHGFEDGVLGVPRGFRSHRMNLFVYSDLNEAIRFASEIEFENEGVEGELEVKVEMAFLDWVIFEEFQIRGGAILTPLGRTNVNHDGPARELTDRPLVSTFVIPTTMTEPGIGIHGEIHPASSFSLRYETYATNGFRLLDRDGELAVPVTELEQLLREGRPSLGGDTNKDLASTGRVSVAALGAMELGASWHVGTYDELSNNLLSIFAGDVSAAYGPFAIEGEIAIADFERDAFARTAGVPGQFWGWYLQASASRTPRVLKETWPQVFGRDGASIGAVFRYDWVDLDGDRGEAIEPGVTFRPFADTVFKASWRFSLERLGIQNVPGREGFDDDGFIFSLASYF